MIYIGIDPDLNTTAVAAVWKVGNSFDFDCAIVDSEALKEDTAQVKVAKMASALAGFRFDTLRPEKIDVWVARAAVEMPRYYPMGKNTANPNDLIALGAVAGAAFAGARRFCSDVTMVLPQTWKGQVTKPIHQRRTYEALGVPIWKVFKSHAVPDVRGSSLERFSSPEWKHLGDALGLALWLYKQVTEKA